MQRLIDFLLCMCIIYLWPFRAKTVMFDGHILSQRTQISNFQNDTAKSKAFILFLKHVERACAKLRSKACWVYFSFLLVSQLLKSKLSKLFLIPFYIFLLATGKTARLLEKETSSSCDPLGWDKGSWFSSSFKTPQCENAKGCPRKILSQHDFS